MAQQTYPEWAVEPLSLEDQQLVEAYRRAGRSVDDLAYTPEFDQICQEIEVPINDSSRHAVYRRLLNLRKQGRLPRVFAPFRESTSRTGE